MGDAIQTPRLVIFDLDDTLIQTHAASSHTWRTLAEEFAPEAGIEESVLHTAIDHARKWFWADAERHHAWRLRMAESASEALRMAARDLGRPFEDAARLQHFADRYTKLFFESLFLFPNALDVLHELRARGTSLAMITNGGAEWQRRKINQHTLAPLFDCIIVEGEFGVGKPAPEIYRHALDTLGVDAHDAWMVGDRLDWDVLGPQKLGITGVWFDFAARGLPEARAGDPDRVIRALADLSKQLGF
ncbi:MAG: HAD family hydrolase [Chloroflexi bacterium]|nr:HAD family hydrolase [Chloroflexota bacterium]